MSYIISLALRFCSDDPGTISKKFPPKRLEDVILAEESSGIFMSLLMDICWEKIRLSWNINNYLQSLQLFLL